MVNMPEIWLLQQIYYIIKKQHTATKKWQIPRRVSAFLKVTAVQEGGTYLQFLSSFYKEAQAAGHVF